MFEDNPRRGAIVEAAMRFAAARGWENLTLSDIATEAHLGLADVVREVGSKTAILGALRREIDVQLLKRLDSEKPEGTPREKLFDVVMTRLELLQPYRAAMKRISRDLRCRPVESAPIACGATQSRALMLEVSGIRTQGAEGCIKVRGLGCALSTVAKTWVNDSDDNGRTMAALDKALRRAEQRWNGYAAMRNGFCGLANVLRPGRRDDMARDAPPPPVQPAPPAGGPVPGPAPA